MIRKSLFVLTLISLVALIAFGVTRSGLPTKATASATESPVTEPPIAQENGACNFNLEATEIVLGGLSQTKLALQTATVKWNVQNTAPCYREQGYTVTVTAFSNEQSLQKVVTAFPRARQASVPLGFTFKRPITSVVATVRGTIVPLAAKFEDVDQISKTP